MVGFLASDKGESLPIRDEPEDEVSFQYKMSLGRVAC